MALQGSTRSNHIQYFDGGNGGGGARHAPGGKEAVYYAGKDGGNRCKGAKEKNGGDEYLQIQGADGGDDHYLAGQADLRGQPGNDQGLGAGGGNRGPRHGISGFLAAFAFYEVVSLRRRVPHTPIVIFGECCSN